MNKAFFYLLVSLLAAASCSPKVAVPTQSEDIVILYDNDVHCAAKGYAAMASLERELSERYKYVTLTSSGDFVQGGALGAVSKGEYMVTLMNRVGYDYVTLGNHEFDYGIPRQGELVSMLEAQVVDCNFYSTATGKRLYSPYKIAEYGYRKVAFVGVSTPYSFASSTPSNFRDKEGNWLYSLSIDDIYDVVQDAVNDARKDGADYVILLSHLGIDFEIDSINAYTMIANTAGIDAVLDGHSHSIIPSDKRLNKEGKEVILTSTGAYFNNIGCLTIASDGSISSKLVSVDKYDRWNASLTSVVDSIMTEYAKCGNRPVGSCEAFLRAKDDNGEWIVRSAESGIGDFCADALRYVTGCDIALLGGGTIRADLPKTDTLTFNHIYSMFPFGNTIAKATVSGQQIMDLLEFSMAALPGTFGAFFQVSGLKFDVDITTPSPVEFNKDKVFVRINGRRRVSNVKVLKAKSGKYESIDPSGSYTVAGNSFTLLKHGDGQTVISEKLAVDLQILDTQVIESYIKDFLNGVVPARYAVSEGRINLK